MRISPMLVTLSTALSGLAVLSSPAPASAAPAPRDALSWSIDLGQAAPAELNVSHSRAGIRLTDPRWRPAASPDPGGYGTATLAPHPFAGPVGQVAVSTRASVPAGAEVNVEVSGQRPDGNWTEWRTATPQAPAALPSASVSVQVRITLRAAPGGQSPTLSALRLVAQPSAPPVEATATPLTFRVFATREGLVGGTTANGHRITTRDHFVALPSGRALSPLGSTQFSVRVCNPANGRCETAPVWDVGPWNTRDDYWNPASVRQNWADLPQGTPEAQAAFNNGYNGGRDQFGRQVGNPAGIDLADGTFIDGLAMADNGFVNVTYLWTGTQPAAWPTVSSGSSGERVRTVQYLLGAAGASLTVDGVFGSATASAVAAFQRAHGLSADGVVGPATWPVLVVTVAQGSSGPAVRAVQSQLTAHGFSTTVDGVFGAGTASSLRAFQSAAGLSADGIAGTATWQALVA